MKRLNFTWNCTRFEKDETGPWTTLYVDLKFNSPTDISPFAEQDSIFVNLTRAVNYDYVNNLDGVRLRKQDYIMRKKIRLQMEQSAQT